MNRELPDVQAALEKAEEPEIKLPTPTESSKKQENSRKTSTSALLTMPKPLTMWTKTNSGKTLCQVVLLLSDVYMVIDPTCTF